MIVDILRVVTDEDSLSLRERASYGRILTVVCDEKGPSSAGSHFARADELSDPREGRVHSPLRVPQGLQRATGKGEGRGAQGSSKTHKTRHCRGQQNSG